MSEETPLLSSPLGMGHLVNPHDTTRRRNVNNNHGQNGMEQETSLMYEGDQILSATPFVPPPPPSPSSSNDKNHGTRLEQLGQMRTRLSSNVRKWMTPKSRRNRTEEEEEARLNRSGDSGGIDDGDDDEIREYYEDTFNDQPWRCSFGTSEDDGIWLNTSDQAGTIMSFSVWILIAYSAITMTLMAHGEHIHPSVAMISCTIGALAWASHAKTTFTDPGSVPDSAVPVQTSTVDDMEDNNVKHLMCSQCRNFKPKNAHHCRICNRCISRMDHHCPWMNNCVGAGNFKHFLLFLFYAWIGSAFSLLIFGWNYFLCFDEQCMFTPVLIQLVRAMTIICIGTFLFTSSMIMNVTYGIMTGIGTIDRLKKKANNTILQATDEPILLKDIFGIGGYYTWPFPIDPLFEDYDRVMGYSTPQRLLREQQQKKATTTTTATIVLPSEVENSVVDSKDDEKFDL